MLFQFRLRSLEEVEPWGDEKPALHWFGLSDGWCWWRAGSQELFRYTQPVLAHWAAECHNYQKILPYVGYQLARPWEDILQCLPDVLDPVPDDLIQRTQNIEQWQNLCQKASAWSEDCDDEQPGDLLESAFGWWSERSWDAGYLRHPPKIWLWTQDDTFHLQWDNRGVNLNGLPVWEATYGEITLSVTAFIEEVKSFHERLMTAMAERVAVVCSGGLRSDIDINLDWLVQEQQDRSSWLNEALNRKPLERDWDKVREAISTVEQMCYNNRVEGL